MKHVELARKSKSSSHWTRLAAASLLAVAALAGCGGGDDGAPGATGATGATGAPGTDATATVKVAALSPEQWAASNFTGTVTAVTIASPPVVSFKVTDSAGNPVVGLGSTSKSATATLPSYPNLSFAIAKLVPGANNSPSKWVSYVVTTVPTKNATTGAITAAAPTRPSTDNTGTLVDNGDGSYKYTFYRDITKIKADVAAMTVTAPNVLADLGDLTYDPTLTHRVTVAISGNAPGTGTNTANGVQVVAGVPMKNPVNAIYDFIPATGKTVTATDAQRNVTSMAACMSCHSKFEFHGGGRQDPQYCVVCHTDQRKYGRTDSVATGNAYSGSTYRIDGKAVGDFPTEVHKIHMGHKLTKTGYDYAGVKFNEILYPQPVTNCVKCHDGSANAVNKTAQGDNWKNVPSLLACSSCHDGIDFKTGAGTTLSGSAVGHIGGGKTDDKTCILCHDAASIPVYHVTVDPTGANGRGGYPLNTALDTPTVGYPSGQGPAIPVASQLNSPAGVYKINFEIKSVTVAAVTGGKQATVVYRTLKDGAPVTFNATGNLIDNVDGNPGIYLAYGTPVDGITTPVDWNGPTSAAAKFKELRLGTGGTQTGPDASGYYTVVLSHVIPSTAKMITAAVGLEYNGFVQLGLAAYPKGIRLREPAFAMKTATGETARRAIVSNDKCLSCHGQLGVAPSFHSGARNNGEGCAICHQPSTATGHVGLNYSFGGGWSVSVKNLVHSIHASKVRANDFTYEATATNPTGFAEVTYPGVLNRCEQCHVAGSYDFSASANAAALPNLLWTTEAKGNMLNDLTTNPTGIASIGLSPWVTSLGRGQVNYSADNLVTSPVTSSCFGCHDSKTAVAHMQLNGGTVYGSVSAVSNSTTGSRTISGFSFTKVETCSVCHAPGKVADIKAVHMK